MFPRKHRTETPIERIFRQVTGRKMNRMERRYFLRGPRSKRNPTESNCTITPFRRSFYSRVIK